DMNMASIIATAFAILSNANAEAAFTIAIPISVLGQILGILMRTILSNLTHVADRFIEQGKISQARRIPILNGSGFYALRYFIP
ncbi:PTS sugar transporter subunit IIC, partial [Enterococcus faecium]|uniref:PTS sugar transporter subunit IIC n=1 Tax=Enterococcus faecium TaxID=1352 RepID=UPI003CC51DFA